MTTHVVHLSLPVSIHARLVEFAEASALSLEAALLQCIRGGMPPSLAKVPADFHGELLALNRLDDQELWRVGEGKWPGPETADDAARKADLPTLRRAYAFAVLKWRGHPVPEPAEFFVE
jgi:hypothetical protein